MAVSGRTPPRELAETLAAYERGEINVLINAQLLAEGWNSPRATVCMHLAPTASKRVYQQRIGRIMRTHARKEAGIVVDFVPKRCDAFGARVVSLHSLLDSDFYREGARVTPAPRRRSARRARRRLSPAPWLVPVAGRRTAARGDQARMATRRPALPGRRRTALLGDDRRSSDPSTSAPSSHASSRRVAPRKPASRRSFPSAPRVTAGCA